ncbi:MAG TPA: hypothetical protein VKS60_24035 [Stellaceae bacterium]|nr:hypothetical protein [Stellaceae bacterium]
MKLVAWIITAAVGLNAAGIARAEDPAANGSQCINVAWIDHTQVVDDSTILFFVKGGKTLKNTLVDRCVGLRLATRGFTYVARNDEVCGNLQSIRVNDTGQVCLLGPFSPYTPPAPAKP